MQIVTWTDPAGWVRRSLLPEGADPSLAPTGVPEGVELELTLDTDRLLRDLQNELRRRGLWTAADVRRNPTAAAREVLGALQSTLRVDVAEILRQYTIERST